MKILLAYITTLLLSLFTGKLVAGAISGIIITPIVKPLERFTWVSRYLVPLLQGIAMGFVAVYTAEWVLRWFSLKTDWAVVAMLVVGFGVIASILMRNPEEKAFHLWAACGEIVGIFLAAFFLFNLL